MLHGRGHRHAGYRHDRPAHGDHGRRRASDHVSAHGPRDPQAGHPSTGPRASHARRDRRPRSRRPQAPAGRRSPAPASSTAVGRRPVSRRPNPHLKGHHPDNPPLRYHSPHTSAHPCGSVPARECPCPHPRFGRGFAGKPAPTHIPVAPSARGLASYASARSITSRRSRDSSSAARRSSSARICSPRALSTFCQRVSGWARRAAVCGFIASSFSTKPPMRR